MDETTPVRSAHRFDESRLAEYLRDRLEGFDGSIEVRQFSGGQSNPTFLLSTRDRKCVLRKKPPGKLLPSAHQVEREYRIMTALGETNVPVCRTLLLCEDEMIIGTPFFLMDYVEGRVFRNLLLPEMTREERAAIYDAMNDVLARLHKVDYESLGLADFGRPGNYYSRQISRWTKQYELAQTEDIEAMNKLILWLPTNIPAGDETTLVHGDYRLENMIFHPTEPRILAVIDWELSTLGHPLADLAYNCMTYYINYGSTLCLRNVDSEATGIPDESDYIAEYCRRTGRGTIDNWDFYLAFSLFRSASIAQGVYKRGLEGNASSESSLLFKAFVRAAAEQTWEMIEARRA